MDHDKAMNENTLERYLLSELNDAERSAFEEHYFACPVCAEEVVLASKFLDNARPPLLRLESGRNLSHSVPVRAPEEERKERPAPAAPKAPRPNWWDRWLAIAPRPVLAGLCAALAIALVIKSSPESPTPHVVGSYFVNSTRAAGNEPRRIQVDRNQRFVALLFSRTDDSIARFDFTLESSTGDAILQFNGAAPNDTDDVQVLIPAERLQPGRYMLRVRDAATKTPAATLPFEIVRN